MSDFTSDTYVHAGVSGNTNVYWNRSRKMFESEPAPGREVEDKSWEKIEDKITRALADERKQKQVKGDPVPFTLIQANNDGIKFRDGFITGIHGGNGNAIIKYGTQPAKQATGWDYRGSCARALTADEKETLRGLHKASKEAAAAYESQLGGLTIKLAEHAKQAWTKGDDAQS